MAASSSLRRGVCTRVSSLTRRSSSSRSRAFTTPWRPFRWSFLAYAIWCGSDWPRSRIGIRRRLSQMGEVMVAVQMRMTAHMIATSIAITRGLMMATAAHRGGHLWMMMVLVAVRMTTMTQATTTATAFIRGLTVAAAAHREGPDRSAWSEVTTTPHHWCVVVGPHLRRSNRWSLDQWSTASGTPCRACRVLRQLRNQGPHGM